MDHPNPFERERADGGIVTFSALFLLVVKGPSPRRIRDRTFGVFMEGLAQELRTVPTPMRPSAFPAALDHRRNAAVGLHALGIGVPGAVRAECGQKTRREDGPSSGQALEEERVGMFFEQLGDLLVVTRDGAVQRSQLLRQHLDGQAVSANDGRVLRQGLGGSDGRQQPFDQIGTTDIVRVVERPDGLGLGALQGFERGPFQQPVAGHGRAEVRSRPLDCPNCLQSLEAPPDMIGLPIDCPVCKKAFRIPQRETLEATIPKELLVSRSMAQTKSKQKGSKFHLAGLSTIAVLIIALLLPFMGISCNGQKLISMHGYSLIKASMSGTQDADANEITSDYERVLTGII